MPEDFYLYLILWFFYIFECSTIININSISVLTYSGIRWKLKYPGLIFGNQQWGVIIKNPIPPLGITFICQQWPISISDKAVCSFTSLAITEIGRPEQLIRSFQFNEIKDVKVISKTVKINDKDFVECSSKNVASNISELITNLVKAPENARANLIKRKIDDSFNIEEISGKIIKYGLNSKLLHLFCNLLWINIFFIPPILFWKIGRYPSIYILLFGIFIFHFSILLIFFRTHNNLFPSMNKERVKSILMMSIYPLISIRAHDFITRDIIDIYHPLAIIGILCNRKDFINFAKKIFLDLQYPIPLEDLPDEVKEIDNYFRLILLRSIKKYLVARGVDTNEFLNPKFEKDDGFVSYCPRCQCGYYVYNGICKSCFGVKLMTIRRLQKEK